MGSSPTLRTSQQPSDLVLKRNIRIQFAVYLLQKGNRESTIERKLKYLKHLTGTPDDMTRQVLKGRWTDKVKSNALDVLVQYSDFLKIPYSRPSFRAYDNTEVYVPSPEMVKQFIYRVRSIPGRARILIAIETGASSGEVWRLTWKGVNLKNKTLTVKGIKGHRTVTYPVSDELISLLIQVPKSNNRIFVSVKDSKYFNDAVASYKKRLAIETGNSDFLKIHFHTFRHYAISWYYFKTKDIVLTQRFARHCNIANTLKYVHIVKLWIKSDNYKVVYAEDKQELTNYLTEGYTLVTKTDWGYCLTKPKQIQL